MRESNQNTSQTKNSSSSQYYKSMKDLKTLTKNEDRITYNLYLPLPVPDIDKIDNKSDRDIIESLIEQLEMSYINDEVLSYGCTIRSMITQKIDTVVKYTEQGYGQAGLLLMIAHQLFLQGGQNTRDAFNPDVKKLQTILKGYSYKNYHEKIMNRSIYPKYMAHVGERMLQQSQPDSSKMIETAIAYSEPYAFITFGLFFTRSGKFRKAYEMFKNAQFYGYAVMAAHKICYLFSTGDINFPKNQELADKYNRMSNNNGLGIDPPYLQDLRRQVLKSQNIKKNGQIQAFKLQLEQSKMLAYFIRGQDIKLEDGAKPMKINKVSQQFSFQVVIKISHQGIICTEQRDTQRYCLVSFGNIQVTNIENFYLLLRSGTKFIIKKGTKLSQIQYKVAADCTARDIVVSKNNKNELDVSKVSEKLRKCAKLLFTKQLYVLSLQLYNYMAMLQFPDLDVIHCNRGLTNQKIGEIPQAIKCYKKSLLISKENLKSQYKLSMLYIKRGQTKQARRIINVMNECDEKKQVIAQLEKYEQQSRWLPG